MGAIGSTIDQFRRPEYTGENRCYPCTAVNVTIALAVALVVAALVAGTDLAQYAVPAGVTAFVLCCVPIALRGYLVPGTPTLTKRYFPSWLLDLFGKPPSTEFADGGDEGAEIDLEEILLAAGALEPRPDGEDLQLVPSVREEWRAEMDSVSAEDSDHERLADILGTERDNLSVQEFSTSFRAFHNGGTVGTWESDAAYVADVAAAAVLEERIDDWDDLSVRERGKLLNGLRLFLEACPNCGGDLSFGTDTVQSCCSTREVAALTCEACDDRLFESRPL